MQLLGTYNSNLASFQYQQLLALLQAAVSSGDLSSGSAFDKATLLDLEQQATNFAELPLATAGTRAWDESLLQPISLLQARFKALLAETNNFTSRAETLLSLLQAETDLLDQLLAADSLQNWIASQPQLAGARAQGWDFLTGQGKTSAKIAPIDPANGVLYTNEFDTGSVFDVSVGELRTGLLAPAATSSLPVKNLKWTFPNTGKPDELYGPDMSWTELTLVEDLPQVAFNSQPSVKVILPVAGGTPDVVTVQGQVPGGAIPTYLRLLFYPRTQQITTNVLSNSPATISPYSIDPDSVVIYSINVDGSPKQFFNQGADYTVDPSGSFTALTFSTSTTVIVTFVENFPAYQCSADQENWSDVIMLDTNRAYRDDETNFVPVGIQNGMFPLTDETGVPSGLYFTLNGKLKTDYTLLVTTPGASSYGPNCVLTVELDQAKYCSALHLKSFQAFPAKLISIELEGQTASTRTKVFGGSLLVDREMDIRFPRQLVGKIYLTFVQENYTIIEYQDLSTDSLRRSTMATVEASLPFSLGQYIPPVTTAKRGYQYAIGLESIEGRDVQPLLPGILVQGPYTVEGCPLIVRFDAQYYNTCQAYLCYEAYDINGVLLDSNTMGVPMLQGQSFVIPYAGGLDLRTVARVQISLKFALRDASSIFTRYNLQALLR